MKHTLPLLPYSYHSLEPAIDAQTMEIHYTKHHQTYVDKLNAALEKHPALSEKPLEWLLTHLAELPEDIRGAVRNHGGGHLNHSLFWTILASETEDRVFRGVLADAIVQQFGNFDDFKRQFSDAALNRFGSGWAWLVYSNGGLELMSTPNQDSPLMEGKLPLLGLDVWEHAYYLKYQQKRADYIAAFFSIINWKKASELYTSAQKA